jgi:hypothetical protein
MNSFQGRRLLLFVFLLMVLVSFPMTGHILSLFTFPGCSPSPQVGLDDLEVAMNLRWGTFSMEFDHYAQVPAETAQEMMKRCA